MNWWIDEAKYPGPRVIINFPDKPKLDEPRVVTPDNEAYTVSGLGAARACTFSVTPAPPMLKLNEKIKVVLNDGTVVFYGHLVQYDWKFDREETEAMLTVSKGMVAP
jgi:hypothetical protein